MGFCYPVCAPCCYPCYPCYPCYVACCYPCYPCLPCCGPREYNEYKHEKHVIRQVVYEIVNSIEYSRNGEEEETEESVTITEIERKYPFSCNNYFWPQQYFSSFYRSFNSERPYINCWNKTFSQCYPNDIGVIEQDTTNEPQSYDSQEYESNDTNNKKPPSDAAKTLVKYLIDPDKSTKIFRQTNFLVYVMFSQYTGQFSTEMYSQDFLSNQQICSEQPSMYESSNLNQEFIQQGYITNQQNYPGFIPNLQGFIPGQQNLPNQQKFPEYISNQHLYFPGQQGMVPTQECKEFPAVGQESLQQQDPVQNKFQNNEKINSNSPYEKMMFHKDSLYSKKYSAAPNRVDYIANIYSNRYANCDSRSDVPAKSVTEDEHSEESRYRKREIFPLNLHDLNYKPNTPKEEYFADSHLDTLTAHRRGYCKTIKTKIPSDTDLTQDWEVNRNREQEEEMYDEECEKFLKNWSFHENSDNEDSDLSYIDLTPEEAAHIKAEKNKKLTRSLSKPEDSKTRDETTQKSVWIDIHEKDAAVKNKKKQTYTGKKQTKNSPDLRCNSSITKTKMRVDTFKTLGSPAEPSRNNQSSMITSELSSNKISSSRINLKPDTSCDSDNRHTKLTQEPDWNAIVNDAFIGSNPTGYAETVDIEHPKYPVLQILKNRQSWGKDESQEQFCPEIFQSIADSEKEINCSQGEVSAYFNIPYYNRDIKTQKSCGSNEKTARSPQQNVPTKTKLPTKPKFDLTIGPPKKSTGTPTPSFPNIKLKTKNHSEHDQATTTRLDQSVQQILNQNSTGQNFYNKNI